MNSITKGRQAILIAIIKHLDVNEIASVEITNPITFINNWWFDCELDITVDGCCGVMIDTTVSVGNELDVEGFSVEDMDVIRGAELRNYMDILSL